MIPPSPAPASYSMPPTPGPSTPKKSRDSYNQGSNIHKNREDTPAKSAPTTPTTPTTPVTPTGNDSSNPLLSTSSTTTITPATYEPTDLANDIINVSRTETVQTTITPASSIPQSTPSTPTPQPQLQPRPSTSPATVKIITTKPASSGITQQFIQLTPQTIQVNSVRLNYSKSMRIVVCY